MIELSAVGDGSDGSRYSKKAEVESMIDIFRSNILVIRIIVISMAWYASSRISNNTVQCSVIYAHTGLLE